MKCGVRVALGVAGGYFLGRTRKMKLALALAGAAAGRRGAAGPAGLLQGGAKVLRGTPELSRLTDEVRGKLLDAGKMAMVAALTRQIDSVSDRLAQRATDLSAAGAKTRSQNGGRARPDEREEEEDTSELDSTEYEAEEEEEEPESERQDVSRPVTAAVGAAKASVPGRRRSQSSDEQSSPRRRGADDEARTRGSSTGERQGRGTASRGARNSSRTSPRSGNDG
jgi:hypothetical protein